MPETMSLEFKGGKEMEAALRKLPDEIAGEVLQTSLFAGARPVQLAAQEKARVRVGPRRRPGTVALADSIQIMPSEMDAAHAVVLIGTRVKYAHLREFGHRLVARGPSREGLGAKPSKDTPAQSTRRVLLRRALKVRREAASGGQVPPYPFLRPALDEKGAEAVGIINRVLGREIEAAFRRLAPKVA